MRELRPSASRDAIERRAATLFAEYRRDIFEQNDRLLAGILAIEWLAGIAAALWISPRAWAGLSSTTHIHVWAAALVGGATVAFPIALALLRPGAALTRHVSAVAQVLMSALFIQISGGRIETHFHVFASLALLAFYRDWPVLGSASVVVAADHYFRGILWPESVYGVVGASDWRWLEHAGWVILEDAFLAVACVQGVRGLRERAERQAQLEATNEIVEAEVARRTAELRESEERFRQLAENVDDCFWLTTADKRELLYVSPAYEKIWGRPVGSLSRDPRAWLEAVHPDDRARIEAAAVAQRQIAGEFDEVFRVVRADGSIRWVRDRAFPVRNERGEVYRVAGLAEDITALRRTEEALSASEDRLRQAAKMEAVGRLAGGIAHDFNNLLTAIIGGCDMLHATMLPADPARGDVEDIRKAGQRAAGLTRQLLAYSRKQVMQPKVISLNDVVADLERMLRRLIGEDIRLVGRLDPTLGRIKADRDQLDQVIVNLAVNARDAMPHGGDLLIETRNLEVDAAFAGAHPDVRPGSYVLLAITDTGCGMSAETREHLFEPFFTTKDMGKGTGLGLATVYGIVKQSGGEITVYSEVGQGTTFRIYLPRADVPVGGRDPTALPEVVGGTETILVVEDEEAVRSLVVRVLERRGYTVLSAAGPLEALEIVERHRGSLHMVLTDVVMPGGNGRDLAERVVAKRPDARVMYMSGYTADAIAHRGVLEPGVALLEKPFGPDTAAIRIREVLDSPLAPRLAGGAMAS